MHSFILDGLFSWTNLAIVATLFSATFSWTLSGAMSLAMNVLLAIRSKEIRGLQTMMLRIIIIVLLYNSFLCIPALYLTICYTDASINQFVLHAELWWDKPYWTILRNYALHHLYSHRRLRKEDDMYSEKDKKKIESEMKMNGKEDQWSIINTGGCIVAYFMLMVMMPQYQAICYFMAKKDLPMAAVTAWFSVLPCIANMMQRWLESEEALISKTFTNNNLEVAQDLNHNNNNGNRSVLPLSNELDARVLARYIPAGVIFLWPNLMGYSIVSFLQLAWIILVTWSLWADWSKYLAPKSKVLNKMNYQKMTFWEYTKAWCSIGTNGTLGWLLGFCRKLLPVPVKNLETILHNMLTESFLVMGIVDGDDTSFVSEFFVPFWPDGNKKHLIIKALWDKPIIQSKLLDGKELSFEDAIIIVCIQRLYVIHTKVHAIANWAHEKASFPGRSETILYNHFGTVTFTKLCKFWSWFTYDHSNYFEKLIAHSLSQPFSHSLKFLEFSQKSRLIRFLLGARQAVQGVFKGLSHREIEGIFSTTVMHSIDHYTMGKTLDPLVLMNGTSLPQMRSLVLLTELGLVHDLPLVNERFRMSQLQDDVFQSLSKRLIEIDYELGSNVDFAIVK